MFCISCELSCHKKSNLISFDMFEAKYKNDIDLQSTGFGCSFSE